MHAVVDLEAEYRLTRAALMKAGVDVTDSMDGLYRDWRRWRDKRRSLAPTDPVVPSRVPVPGHRHSVSHYHFMPKHVASGTRRFRIHAHSVPIPPC